MKKIQSQSKPTPQIRFDAFVTHAPQLIEQAQRLRYRVFAQEMGAKLKSENHGLDQDKVDEFCDHLIVFDHNEQKIVGYTRLLNQFQAKQLGYFYSQSEFQIDPVLALSGKFLEIGRTCVDPSCRGTAVLTILWSALAKYAQQGGYSYLIGCASISPGPNGFSVDAVYRNIDEKNLAPPSLNVRPLVPVPDHLRCQRDESGIPPLLKTYLRFGVQICGQPCWDPSFNVMDLFILLPLENMEKRYNNRYFNHQTSTNDIQTPVNL